MQVSDIDYLRKMTENNSSDGGTQGTEEDDEDDLLKEEEEMGNWDVFDDYHKFQNREKKLRERKKLIVQQQKKQIELQKIEEIEM